MNTIALTGGGTAGHIMPNLALIPQLKKHFDRIIYLGAGGMEQELATRAGLRFFKTQAIRLCREHVLRNLKIPFVLYQAVGEAKKILVQQGVNCVFCKGGYVALPASLAAKSLGIPVVCHESDVTLGVANKLVSRFAAGTITSFPETKGGTFIGNPIREEIFLTNPQRTRAELNLQNKPTVLVVGGSLGAEALNRAVWEVLPQLCARYNVLHIAGKGYDGTVQFAGYHQFKMTPNIADLFGVADLVVTRAGANTLGELSALKLRTIAVPLPKSNASRGDQMQNALSYARRGDVTLLAQSDLNGTRLILEIERGLAAPKKARGAQSTVNQDIVKFIVEKCKIEAHG